MEKERHLPNPSICWVQKPFVEKGDFKPYITSFRTSRIVVTEVQSGGAKKSNGFLAFSRKISCLKGAFSASNFSWKFIANILRESIAYESPLPVNSTLVSSFLVVRIAEELQRTRVANANFPKTACRKLLKDPRSYLNGSCPTKNDKLDSQLWPI